MNNQWFKRRWLLVQDSKKSIKNQNSNDERKKT